MEINELFELKRNDESIQKALKINGYKWQKSISKDELENIKLIAIWKTIKKFGDCPLLLKLICIMFKWECSQYLRFLNNGKIHYNIINQDIDSHMKDDKFEELIEPLHEKYKNVLRKRFVESKTLKEIGDEEGYSYEYANILIKEGIERLKKCV